MNWWRLLQLVQMGPVQVAGTRIAATRLAITALARWAVARRWVQVAIDLVTVVETGTVFATATGWGFDFAVAPGRDGHFVHRYY